MILAVFATIRLDKAEAASVTFTNAMKTEIRYVSEYMTNGAAGVSIYVTFAPGVNTDCHYQIQNVTTATLLLNNQPLSGFRGHSFHAGKSFTFYCNADSVRASYDCRSVAELQAKFGSNPTAVLTVDAASIGQVACGKTTFTQTSAETCTSVNSGYYTCGVCGNTCYSGSSTKVALGHDWHESSIYLNPTVYNTGEQSWVCSRNAAHTTRTTIPQNYFNIFSGNTRIKKIYSGSQLVYDASYGNLSFVKSGGDAPTPDTNLNTYDTLSK